MSYNNFYYCSVSDSRSHNRTPQAAGSEYRKQRCPQLAGLDNLQLSMKTMLSNINNLLRLLMAGIHFTPPHSRRNFTDQMHFYLNTDQFPDRQYGKLRQEREG